MLLLVFCSNYLRAQKTPIIIRDTINLCGYIYNNDGSPAKYVRIISTQYQAEYSSIRFKIGTETDTTGFFKLNGIKPNDTLTVASRTFYDIPPYYNKGSRYMVIYLPAKRVIDINSQAPVLVTKKRVHRRAPAIYHPFDFNGCILFPDVQELPRFRNGISESGFAEFAHIVRSHIEYPEKAVANNIEGTVQIGFTIERDGTVINFKVLSGIGYGCAEEVIKALKLSGHWRPAIDNGRPIAINETISVQFKLTDK